jgi:transposase
LNRSNHTIGKWMNELESRTHRNVLVVAVANKLARIAWAVLAKGEAYRATPPLEAN